MESEKRKGLSLITYHLSLISYRLTEVMGMYTTKSGDMFDLIAYRELGSCDYTEKILNVNRTKLRTVKFRAGEEIKIPDVTQEKISKLPPWLK